LLRPLELIRGAEAAYEDDEAPINSVEGFIRQILGWREFMFWQYWRLMPELYENNFWNARRPLPSFFWDGQTDLNCLRQVLRRALDSGYNHHIERLMILANFSLLAGLDPMAVNEWFLAMYVDAYDWVMAPNVIGMGLHADGGLIASKPYIASANYINKMSDYCPSCAFDRNRRSGEKACPFNFLYWNFLIENEEVLRANPRLGPNVLGLRHLDQAEREKVRKDARSFLETVSNA
jgi:deoxyribodipyrimidine photolyase-related protein